jgi:ABC-type transport system substrate-binding protein
VVNRRTVKITLDRPIVYFLTLISTINADIVDQRVLQGQKAGSYMTQTCSANVGAGPFRFVCLNTNSGLNSFYPSGTTPSMTFEPNPYYYGPKPHIRIVMRDSATSDTNYLSYQSNQVDVVGSVPSGHIAANQNNPGFAKVHAPYVWYFAPNLQQPPFNNVHCRLAFMYAIDQNTLDTTVLHGTQTPLYSVVPRGVLGWYPGADNPHYNPAKSKAELAQCPGGLSHLAVPYWKTGTDADNEMAALQNIMSQVGIKITLKGLQFNDWLNIVNQVLPKTNTAIVLSNWVAGNPDPNEYFGTVLLPGSPINISNYSDPTVNRLRKESDVLFNRQKRAKLIERMSHIVLSEGGMMPIGQQVEYGLLKPWVHGMVPTGYNAWGLLFVPRNNNWANVSISPH